MSQMEKPSLDRLPLGSRDPLVLSDDGDLPVIQVPGAINQYLRDYQRDGIRFLYSHYKNGQGAILADDMGLGKTVQVIALLTALLRKTGSVKDLERFRPDFIRKMENSLIGVSDSSEDGVCTPFLVIGPASVMYNWLDEFETWGHFRVGKYHKQYKRETIVDLRQSKLDVVITTYETCRDNIDELSSVEWNAIFADEVHKIKGTSSEMTRALKKLPCHRRFGLTGTPFQNRLNELWCIMDWANPHCFGDFKSFHKKYGIVIEQGQKLDVTKRQRADARKAQQHLTKAYDTFLLRRTKDLIADQLPHKDDLVVYCRPTDLQTDIYQTILNEADMKYVLTQKQKCSCGSGKTNIQCHFKNSPSGVPVRSLMMTFMHLLLKAANHLALLMPGVSSSGKQQLYADDICQRVFARHTHLVELGCTAAFRTLSDPKYCGKMKVLQGLLTIFKKQKSKVLLFSYSTKLLDVLEAYIMSMGYEYRRLDGSTPSATRMSLVQEFNREPSIFIFLISTKSGGIGLNLTGANVVIIYDPNWNPAHDLQAQDRAYRLGQRRDVRVFRLICAGTIEENIYLRQVFKQQIGSVALERKNAKRLFCGKSISSERQKSDELFGVENLFHLRTGDSCLTTDILLRNDKMEAELRGFQVADYVRPPSKERQDDESVDDRSDSDGIASDAMSINGYTSSEPMSDMDDSSTSSVGKVESSSEGEEEEDNGKESGRREFDRRESGRREFDRRESGRREFDRIAETHAQASVQSVIDFLGRSDVVHMHKNKNLINGGRVEDHITNCALKDVYELHMNSQQPAVQCQRLSSSSSSSESDDALIEMKQRSGHRLKHRGASERKTPKANTTRDSCSKVIGKSHVLLGHTPLAIRRQQFQQLTSSLGLTSTRELGDWVMQSSYVERQQVLQHFYIAHHPHLESLFHELAEEMVNRDRKGKRSTAQHKKTQMTKKEEKERDAVKEKQCHSNQTELKTTQPQRNTYRKTNHFTSLKRSTKVGCKNEQEKETVASEKVLNLRPHMLEHQIKDQSDVLDRFFSDTESLLGRSYVRAKRRSSVVSKAATTTSVALTSANASHVTDDSYSNTVIDEFLAIPSSADSCTNKRNVQSRTRNTTKICKIMHLAEPDKSNETNDKFLDEIFFGSS